MMCYLINCDTAGLTYSYDVGIVQNEVESQDHRENQREGCHAKPGSHIGQVILSDSCN